MAISTLQRAEDGVEMRQLRHHTKNALAAILAQLAGDLAETHASQRVAWEVERRILLTAQISDALFGLTHAPEPFQARVAALSEGVVDLLGNCDQYITVSCRVLGTPLPALQETVLRVTHELVGNAVKHGMCMRLIGRIEVSFETTRDGAVLEVIDDGWGCGRGVAFGEGLSVASAYADAVGGRIVLARVGDRTIAQLLMPQARLDG